MKITIHPLSTLPNQPAGVTPDERMIRNLESSFRGLAQRDVELAERFYHRLFTQHPSLRSMFPTEPAGMALQKRKLMDTLTLVFENLRSPAEVRARLQRLGASHVHYGTRPEHYPIVCEALVAAMADVAGKDWTLELHADWTSAMRLVGDVMMQGGARATGEAPPR